MKYSIAEQYTKSPGVRKGKYSGEDFRKTILKPILDQLGDEMLIVDLDGGFGYSSSFLEEAFGGLVRECNYDKNELLKKISFISEEEKDLPNKIKDYIRSATFKGLQGDD